MEAADAGLMGKCGDPLVGRGGPCPDARRRDDFRIAETLGRQADDEARNAALAHQQVGADADDGERDVLVCRHGLEEGREVFLVGRLVERLGETAGAEPGDLVHLRIRRDAAANACEPVAEAGEKRFAPDHAAASSSGREFLRQRIGPLRDVAGAEEDDEVAGLGDLADHRRDRRRLGDVARVAMAAGADAVDELFAS